MWSDNKVQALQEHYTTSATIPTSPSFPLHYSTPDT